MNYITPTPPAQPAGSLTSTGGNRDYFNGHGIYGNTVGRTGFLVDYMRKQGDGSRENLHSKLNDVNVKLVQGVGASQTWTFRGNYYSEDSNVTYSGLRQDEYLRIRAATRSGTISSTPIGTAPRRRMPYTLNGNMALTTNRVLDSFRRHWWRQSSNSAPAAERRGGSACGGMANLNTTCGNEGRLRQYYAGASSRASACIIARSASPAKPTSACARTSSTRIGGRRTATTPTARSGVLVESNLRTQRRVLELRAEQVSVRRLDGHAGRSPRARSLRAHQPAGERRRRRHG